LKNINGRGFFKASTAAVAAGMMSASRDTSAAIRDSTGSADLTVTGANLLSMDPDNATATAMAVRTTYLE